MLAASDLDPHAPWRALDLGGADVNGTIHGQLPNATWDVVDIRPAAGVTIVADATTWQPDPAWDVAVTTETLEHVPDWAAILDTAAAALAPDGPQLLLVTCASTGRHPHGADGSVLPHAGEHYANIDPAALRAALGARFAVVDVVHQYPPGDAYAWASGVRR